MQRYSNNKIMRGRAEDVAALDLLHDLSWLDGRQDGSSTPTRTRRVPSLVPRPHPAHAHARAGWGLGTRLACSILVWAGRESRDTAYQHILSVASLVPGPHPLTRKGVW